MKRRRLLPWPLLALAVLGVVGSLDAAGLLSRLEHLLDDARAAVLSREVQSDIVIVGIDARSLAELDRWPWPRRYHARLLDQLARSSPSQVFIDIDFSARSNPQDDALLERALAAWDGPSVILPVFFQPASGADAALVLTKPLDRFARHTRVASVNLLPSEDGLVRAMRSSWDVGGETLHSLPALDGRLEAGVDVPIDFSISPSSFGYVSYVDLLSGRIAPQAFDGKRVYVGATALELGDLVSVPVLRSVPGVVVQALAVQTVAEGVPRVLPRSLTAMLLAAWTLAGARLFRSPSWRRNAVALLAAVVLVAGAGAYVETTQLIDVPLAAFVTAAAGIFLAATLQRLDEQTWRAFVYGLGLRRRRALLQSIVESSTDCIVCMDGAGKVRTANPAAMRLFGCAKEQLIGAHMSDFIPSLHADGDDAMGALVGSISEWDARRAETGERFPVEVCISRVRTDAEPLYTAIVRDISERKAQQRKLEHQATHDALTGLCNRAALLAYLETALPGLRPGSKLTLLMLDLCRFKEVNDTLGHDVGDDVLCEVARRFKTALGAQALLARIGGDEFTVAVPLSEPDAIDGLCRRLQESLRIPIDARGIAIEVGLSIGIAIAPDHANDVHGLLKRADVAMYASKRRGTPYEYYQRSDDQHTVRRLTMTSELRSSIAGNGISLHYQPQVDLATGEATSAEALLRWSHPTLGQVSPAEFMTLAESTDLIRPLTYWTLERALAEIAKWQHEGVKLRVAVNLSAKMLQDAIFADRLQSLLDTTQVAPEALELEITESAMMLDPQRASRVVQRLHALGVLIAIDDYGTGFSSLGYLRDLPVHALKLDKSFVIDLEKREDNRVIVQSTMQMAHALGLKVVAEGVETLWVHDHLRRAGYDLGQGYWYSRPLPAEELLSWMRERRAEQSRRAG